MEIDIFKKTIILDLKNSIQWYGQKKAEKYSNLH